MQSYECIEQKEFFKFLASPPSYFPCCTDASAFRGGAQVSNHLIRSPHLVAPPDKSSPYPLQSKLTGMCARNSEHARFWLVCVCVWLRRPTLAHAPGGSIHRSSQFIHGRSPPPPYTAAAQLITNPPSNWIYNGIRVACSTFSSHMYGQLDISGSTSSKSTALRC